MKRKLITFCIIIICFLMECTIFHRLSFASIKPNLLIIITSSFGFMRFLTDVVWGNTLGFYTLLFSVIGYLNGSFRRLFYDDDIKLPIALIAVSELIYGLVTYFCMYLLRGDFAFEAYLRQIIMPELVYTILVTLILYQIILHINKKLEAEEQRSASKFV